MLSEFLLSLIPPEIFTMSVYYISLENESIFHILLPNNPNSVNLSYVSEICGQMKRLGFLENINFNREKLRAQGGINVL